MRISTAIPSFSRVFQSASILARLLMSLSYGSNFVEEAGGRMASSFTMAAFRASSFRPERMTLVADAVMRACMVAKASPPVAPVMRTVRLAWLLAGEEGEMAG